MMETLFLPETIPTNTIKKDDASDLPTFKYRNPAICLQLKDSVDSGRISGATYTPAYRYVEEEEQFHRRIQLEEEIEQEMGETIRFEDKRPLPSMVDGGLKIPHAFDLGWKIWKDQLPLYSNSKLESLAFHYYVFRIPGVRCERRFGLLIRRPLIPDESSAQLPAISIYPHGIIEYQADCIYVGLRFLTPHEVDQCEQFHLHAFHLVLSKPSEESLITAANAVSHPPLPDKPRHEKLFWQESQRNYLIVPTQLKTEDELSQADEEGWSRVDEQDEYRILMILMGGIFPSDDHVRTITLDYAALRTIRSEIKSEVKRIHHRFIVEVPYHSSFEIDWTFIHSYVQGLTTRECDSPFRSTAVSSTPRSSILETRYNGRLYLNLSKQSDLTSLSEFPNKDFINYYDYYQKRWPHITITNPHAPLILSVNFNLSPLNVLCPHPLTNKKKSLTEPEMKLVPDAVHVWTHVTAEWVHTMRMIPAIMHRLERNVAQAELQYKLNLDLNPFILYQSLTSGNAQESFPLKPLENPENPYTTQHGKDWSKIPVSQVHSYERLKFLGDSVLKFIACKFLLAAFPADAEQSITKRKGAMLNMNRLAAKAYEKGIQDSILTHPFTPQAFIPPGVVAVDPTVTPETNQSSVTTTSKLSKHVLADVVASLLGAAYLFGGELAAYQCMIALDIIDDELRSILLFDAHQYLEKGWEMIPLHVQVHLTVQARLLSHLLPTSSSFTSPTPRLSKLVADSPNYEEKMQYEFKNKMLLFQAFTHASWESRDTYQLGVGKTPPVGLPSYERLELLGDAVLELVVSDFIYHSFPFSYESASGDLTFARQKLVNNDSLVMCLVDLKMHKFILHASDPVKDAMKAYELALEEHRASGDQSTRLLVKTTPPPKMVADVFEALLGGVYLDSEFELAHVWKVYHSLVDFDVNWKKREVNIKGGRIIASCKSAVEDLPACNNPSTLNI